MKNTDDGRCMNFIFRTDSSSEIGHGHLMRCLVLAKELKQHGSAIHFICREHSGSAHPLVEEAGHLLHLLPGKRIVTKSSMHRDWLGRTQQEDAQDCNRIIEYLPDRHLVVDHYGLDIEWESRIACDSMTVMDDLADRPHRCNRLVDQSLVHIKQDYEILIAESFDFWGGANVILRDEFRKTANWQDARSGALMICMGGADPRHITTRIVKALLDGLGKTPGQQLVKKIDVVIGQAFDRGEELEHCLASSNLNVALHRGHPNISALMTRSDLCILSCGTMILEACALGVPSIGVALAENQKNTADFLAAKNAILPLDIENEIEAGLALNIENALSKRSTLLSLSEQARIMVDRYAARNIARAIADGH